MSLRVYSSVEELRAARGDAATVVTIGNFDGMHLGHREILRRLVARAREAVALAVAVTFDPHPVKVLRPAQAPPLISTLTQRLAGLAEAGCAAAVVLRFDQKLAHVEPEAFVRDFLVAALGAEAVVVGENFRFGYRQAGDIRLLEGLGRELGFALETVPPVAVRGQVASSSAVRSAVAAGRMTLAARMLSRPFVLTGSIRTGTGTGRRLVVPTLNMDPEQELLPGRGVYATEAFLPGFSGRRWPAVTNIGVRPTFDGQRLAVESHLLGFAEEVSAGPMEIRFCRRLRDERRFASAEELRAQILRDIARARRFFARLERTVSGFR
jgi:riboflavin kinase / FMN adenylyltransferase